MRAHVTRDTGRRDTLAAESLQHAKLAELKGTGSTYPSPPGTESVDTNLEIQPEDFTQESSTKVNKKGRRDRVALK